MPWYVDHAESGQEQTSTDINDISVEDGKNATLRNLSLLLDVSKICASRKLPASTGYIHPIAA